MRRLGVRNQVLAIEVVDKREIEFPDVGDMLIRDPETDFERYVNTADAERPGPDGRGQRRAAGTNSHLSSSCWCRAHPVADRPGLGAGHRPIRAGLPTRGGTAAPPPQGVDEVIVAASCAHVADPAAGVPVPGAAADPARRSRCWCAAYIFASRRKNRRGMRFTNTSMLDVVVPKQSQWRRHVAVALSLLSLITLTAAFARPKTTVEVPRERATVVLVIDASQSMAATDVPPTRLDAAKQAAIEFVRSCRTSTTSRSSRWPATSSILVPPTLQHNTVENGDQLDQAAGLDGHRRGHRHRHARAAAGARRTRRTPTIRRPGAIVLLSDGTNTAGPLAAAGRRRGRQGEGADLHDRVRQRERLRRSRRQAAAGAGRPRADGRDRQAERRPDLRRRSRCRAAARSTRTSAPRSATRRPTAR